MDITAAVRLGRFVARRFPPQVYAAYGVLWTLALESLAALTAGTRWTPSGATAVRAFSVVLVLLFARLLDELKDLDYDRVHNPDRPLVTGAVSLTELRVWMAVVAVGTAGLNLLVSLASAALVTVPMAYCLALAALERRWAAGRDGVLANLALAYPAQLLLGAYVLAGAGSGATFAVPVLVVFAGAFLQFELARKTAWQAEPGRRLYSTVLGPVPAALAGPACAAVAAVVAAALCDRHSAAGWLSVLPLALPAAGTAWFLVRRSGAVPLAPAMGFILGLYPVLIVLGAVGPTTKGV